jgi:hypothetical protein
LYSVFSWINDSFLSIIGYEIVFSFDKFDNWILFLIFIIINELGFQEVKDNHENKLDSKNGELGLKNGVNECIFSILIIIKSNFISSL